MLDRGEISPVSLIRACDLAGLGPLDLNQAVLILPRCGRSVLWVPSLAFISQLFDLHSHRELESVSVTLAISQGSQAETNLAKLEAGMSL